MAKSFYEQKCRICGCDWSHACNDHDYWFAEDLCSACAEAMKPVLFNTPMVQAILENRKTNTRRVVKRKGYDNRIHDPINDFAQNFCDDLWEFGQRWENRIAPQHAIGVHSPFQPGDILYVRETWRIQSAHRFEADAKIEFKAGGSMQRIQFANSSSQSTSRDDYDKFVKKWWNDSGKWHPSIHMPKEAARLFLRVTGVRAERLHDITEDGAIAEGLISTAKMTPDGLDYTGLMAYDQFHPLWDSTVKKADLPLYGWDANPWVWAYKFERVGNREG